MTEEFDAPRFHTTNLIGERYTLHIVGTEKQLLGLIDALRLVTETAVPLPAGIRMRCCNGDIIVNCTEK